jgi:N,N'-diacetyllegionaminate synthase
VGVELIAEVSSNAGGDMALAKEFIQRYADAGANWIKFQSYQVKTLRPNDPQLDWLAQAELSDEAHYELIEECQRNNVKFLTTVFHHSRVPFLKSLGLDTIKIGSGEASNVDLAFALVKAEFARAIVSCGLASPDRLPLNAHRVHLDRLHCVTRYPCPPSMADVLYGRTLQGWSDHCIGLDGCKIAILRGARIIEKHVQLQHQARPPRAFEATVEEFKQLRAFADEEPERLIGRWQHA